MIKKVFLLLTLAITLACTAFHADAQNSHSVSYEGQRYGQQLHQSAQDAPLHAFLLREVRSGHLDKDYVLTYEQALSRLPFHNDMLPYLAHKLPKERSRLLESLVQGKCTCIGPFVYFSEIHDYERVLMRHVDLRPIIDKIQRRSLRADRDGWKIFHNYERLLPRKPKGYYHEVRIPTERLRGPGPQRLVYGEDGEIYYTADHYASFKMLEVRCK